MSNKLTFVFRHTFICSNRKYPNKEHYRTGKSDGTYIHIVNVHILLHRILMDLQTRLHVQRLVRAVMAELKL